LSDLNGSAQVKEIRDAIMHGGAAGRLRTYSRENGGLAGLERLADRHAKAVAAALEKVGPTRCSAGPFTAPARGARRHGEWD